MDPVFLRRCALALKDQIIRKVDRVVSAVIGNELRPGNIWMTKELPALLKNPNVKKITTIDPATGVKTVIFP